MTDLPRIRLPAREIARVRIASVRTKGRTLHAESDCITAPLVVSYGMGTDSTALLVLLTREHLAGTPFARPDRIQFADTGSEKQQTYDYLAAINAYLRDHDFPEVSVVRRGGQDRSLYASGLRLHTMPSLAYGGKSCSLKWKAAAMDADLNGWADAQIAWANGLKVHKLIGYDASPADMRRSDNAGDDRYVYHYPLRDAGLVREQLVRIIDSAGLPQPGKSACFMCPASKREEVLTLLDTAPARLAEALKLEALAMLRTAGERDDWSTVGLGRKWSWREFLRATVPLRLVELDNAYDAGVVEWSLYEKIRDAKLTPQPCAAEPVSAADVQDAHECE